MPNKALHRTAIPLRSIAAGELGVFLVLVNGLDLEIKSSISGICNRLPLSFYETQA
jgi:hypothetical protein